MSTPNDMPQARPRYNNLDLTPTQVAMELLSMGRELAAATADLEELERTSVRANNEHVLAEAKALLRAGELENLTAADMRKAWAIVQTYKERLDAGIASADVRARKQLIDTLKTRVTIGQSVAAALRSEIDLEGLKHR